MDTLLEKRKQLFDRLDQNHNDFKRKTLKLDKEDIYNRAFKIAAYETVYRHMRNLHRFDEQSLEYLLKFRNPLELVTDHYKTNIWVNLNATIDYLCDKQDLTKDYPLMTDKKQPDRER